VGTGAFTTTFTLQDQNVNGSADGAAFVIQNAGTGALGGGGLLGYSGITPSLAVAFDLYSGGSHNSTTDLFINGNVDKSQAIDMGPSGIVLGSNHPLLVTLTYNGKLTLTETVTDTVTNKTFTTSYLLSQTLTQLIGGSAAYVGFTAGTGGETSIQRILNWSGTFTNSGANGGSALDSSGNSNTGTLLGGVTHVGGLPGFGNALHFDGTGYVMTNDSATLDPQTAITVSAWINADTWSNGNERILQKSTGNNDNQYRLLEEGGVLKWDITNVGTVTAALPSTGVWHNVTGTYDGKTMILYVDGNQVASGAASNLIPVTNGPLFVGTKNAGAPLGDHFAGTIDEVRIYSRALTQAEIKLLPFTDRDIGNVAATGSASVSGNGTPAAVYSVTGSGDDIWNNADAFNFLYQPLNGNGSITARVSSITPTDYWAKAAVMIRNTLDANSAFVDLVTTPNQTATDGSGGPHNEDSFQWRLTQGGGPASVDEGAGSAPLPYWIRLTRVGNTFTAFKSADGVNFVPVGSPLTVTMNTEVFIGLAVTAHNNSGVLNTSMFDHVTVMDGPDGANPLLPPWNPGTSLLSGGSSSGPLSAAVPAPQSPTDVGLALLLTGQGKAVSGFEGLSVPASSGVNVKGPSLSPAADALTFAPGALYASSLSGGDDARFPNAYPDANLDALDQVFTQDDLRETLSA
jgi:hypothetical protein